MIKKLTLHFISLGIIPILTISFIGVFLINAYNAGETLVTGDNAVIYTMLLRWDLTTYYFGFRSLFKFMDDVGSIFPRTVELIGYVFNLALNSASDFSLTFVENSSTAINQLLEQTNKINFNPEDGLGFVEILAMIYSVILVIGEVICFLIGIVMYLGSNIIMGAFLLLTFPLYFFAMAIVPIVRLITGYYNLPLSPSLITNFDYPTWEEILQAWANIFGNGIVIA